MQRRTTLLVALLACGAATAAASGISGKPQDFNWDDVLTAKHVPLVRLPSLGPSLLEAMKLPGVRSDAVQNATNNPYALKLSTIMPKLPSLPTFDATEFPANTSDADLAANATAAAAALRVPLVESTVLPGYASALKSRIAGEAAWLEALSNETAATQKSGCSLLPPQYVPACLAVVAKSQSAKVQALSASLAVLQSMEAQLNTDMARKLLAFNRASGSATGGNWMCAVVSALDRAIKDSAAASASGAYAAKAASAVEKLRDFAAGRWGASPWWSVLPDAQLSEVKLVAPCAVDV